MTLVSSTGHVAPSLLISGYGRCFPGCNATASWSWLLTPISHRGEEWVELYFHSPACTRKITVHMVLDSRIFSGFWRLWKEKAWFIFKPLLHYLPGVPEESEEILGKECCLLILSALNQDNG